MRILDRYIFGDVFRQVLLTTVVLVTVIAFGATIKPLASDRLLTVGQTAKYIVLAIVPMLQFALPFAAGFAGTMSLHRMTSDREIQAAAASGVSYRRILLPVVGLGLALSIAMVGLTQWVIPRFWGLLQRAVAQDITALFQAAIERGEPFQLGRHQIFADRLIVESNPADSDADTRLLLVNVAAADLDAEGRIDKDVTASRARVDVYRRPHATYLRLAMVDTVAYNPDAGMLAWAERIDSRTIAIPNILEDDARHMTVAELHALRADPEDYGPLVKVKVELADRLRHLAVGRDIDTQLRERGRLELTPTGPDRPRVVVTAAGFSRGRLEGPGGPIEVVQQRDGEPLRRFEAQRGRLLVQDTAPLMPLAFDLILDDCVVTDVSTPGIRNTRRRVVLDALRPSGVVVPDFADQPTDELLERAAAEPEPASVVAWATRLAQERTNLQLEISGRLWKRYALSSTALLLLCLGAVLAMWKRDSLPLTIYLWAFLPSVLNMIVISSGEHILRDGAVAGGLAVMWSGNVVLLVVLLLAYTSLAKH